MIGRFYPHDRNGDRIEDTLLQRAQTTFVDSLASLTPAESAAARRSLASAVNVELVFTNQITQEQINQFVALGGDISYIYKSVSYGWNGRVPLSEVGNLPDALGGSLVMVQEVKPTQLHMDLATRTGRVRPVWTNNFAGNPAGFSGSTNVTIAILDTGADESHPDLNGRRVYWHDFSGDASPTPVDMVQHGSHVTGIATGTGVTGGTTNGTMFFTQSGTLSGVGSGSFYPNPINLPAATITFNLKATWNGGGSTTLYLVTKNKGASSGWGAVSSITGTSPLTLSSGAFTPSTGNVYSPALLSNGSNTDFTVVCQVTNYPGVGDGFNKFRGVAPGCNWAGAKVFANSGSGDDSMIDSALDDIVSARTTNKIKVANLSLGVIGNPGTDTTLRQKVNTAVQNGIVVVVSAGNDGLGNTAAKREIDDPGRAAYALTVAAANDINQLTDYTSQGFASPGSTSGQEEDFKPDVMAPGGSASYYAPILSVDSNSGDGTAFSDQQTNDYYNIQGTSMASPFTAGCAALVIDAMQQQGTNWDFNSNQHARLVKMLLCATATESNTNREGNANNPTLQRTNAGPNSFPVGKDQFEGFGMINPDAAIEAVSLMYTNGTTNTGTLGPSVTDRRAWARAVSLTSNQLFAAVLTVPAGADYDFYLYSSKPNTYGTPVMLASSTVTNLAGAETIAYVPSANTNAILVVKRISGSGTFTVAPPPPPVANFTGTPVYGTAPLAVTFTNLSANATNYSWAFGDAKTSTNVNPANTYTNAGTYSVTLTAIGLGGTNVFTRSNYITVVAPVVAGFTGTPTNGVVPYAVAFTNLTTGATNYAWNFGDTHTSTNVNPSNIYSNAGLFTVTLTAVGPGGTNVLTRSNYVLGIAPVVAGFVANKTNGVAPLSVNFTNQSSGATNYSWAFGDGNTSASTNAVNTYSNAGIYSVTLTAVGAGGTNLFTRTNYIVIVAPVVPLFTGSTTNGLTPLGVAFTNLSTGATNYSWAFGDGQSSTNVNPFNTYTNAGSFNVTLTATGPGGTNSLTRSNYVVAAAPVVAGFSGSPTSSVAPVTVVFTNVSSGATNYSWNFGDAHTSTNANPSNVYSNAGTYSITLTAVGAGGTNIFTRTNYITVIAPVVPGFTGTPTNGVAPLTVNFTNLTTGATNYLWGFGDSQNSTNLNPANTYTNPGTYTISLTATGPGGANVLTRTNYVVVFAPVVAGFTGSPTNGVAPVAVSFTNLSSGATNYAWNFGDSHTSTNANPSNTYSNAGTYSVTLTAVGAGGTNVFSRTNYVSIVAPVVADFSGAPTNGVAPLIVNFTNLSSGATGYAWNFGDGQNSIISNPANTYSNAGTYSVTLTAVGAGGTNELTRTNYISVVAPVVPDFTGTPTNGVAPLTVNFTNTTTGATNYAWDFGDGQSATNFNSANTYNNPGVYTVSLSATGPGGTNTLARTNYIVVIAPVIADFTAGPTNGVAPLSVDFTNQSSGATTYSWTFGDGQISTNTHPANTYTNPGTYTVALTATGPGGTNALTRSNYIVVVAPVITAFSGAPTNGVAPLTVLFTNQSSGATDYFWTFGDGQTSTNANPSNTYTNPGSYTVGLSASGPGGTNTLLATNYVVAFAPVVAGFSAGPTDGVAPLGVAFTNNSTGAAAFNWDFGDGQTSTNADPTITYTNAGTFTVALTATGPGGTNIFVQTNLIAVFAPVTAAFTGAPTSGVAPLLVNFTNLSSGALGYLWDFGDGQTSTNSNPANTYTNPGNYTVSLTAFGQGGTNSVSLTNYIAVVPPPPVADFAADLTNGIAPLTVTFTNLSSAASDFTWDFGDGHTATNANPANTYTNAGTYSVTLEAVGAGGTNTLFRTNYIIVAPAPPLADFAADFTNGVAPLTVSFTNLSIAASDYAWDFGDGNSSTNANPVNMYTNPGAYTVTLVAAGPGGTNVLARTNYITVLPPPPVADFVADVTNGIAPLTVGFTNLSAAATTFTWDFGDGNATTNNDPINVYTNPGAYTVTLTAVGAGGTNTLTRTNYIVVTPPPPIADFLTDLTNGVAPLTVAFTNLSSAASEFLWDFGDGNTVTNADPINIYTNPGTYAVTLTANGPGGTNSLTRTNYVVVFAPVVADFFATPTNGTAPLSVAFTNASVGAFEYLWDFGDLQTTTNASPSNIYTNPGTYTITLTAFGPGGTNTFARTNYILVLAPLPPPPIQLVAAILMPGGAFQFAVSNADGSPVTLAQQTRIDLYAATDATTAFTNWMLLTNATWLTNGVLQTTDPDATTAPQRYYRAVQRP